MYSTKMQSQPRLNWFSWTPHFTKEYIHSLNYIKTPNRLQQIYERLTNSTQYYHTNLKIHLSKNFLLHFSYTFKAELRLHATTRTSNKQSTMMPMISPQLFV